MNLISKVRYHATWIASQREPMALGVLGSTGVIEVDAEQDAESMDLKAYLLATSMDGELQSLMRQEVGKCAVTVWEAGMAIPGVRVTQEMVGMTFSQAIQLSMKL